MPPKNIVTLDSKAQFEISQDSAATSLPGNTGLNLLRSGPIYDAGPTGYDDVTIGSPTLDPVRHFSGGIVDDTSIKPGKVVDKRLKKTSYSFYETMSEEVLHRYLDRALQINGLSQMYWVNPDGSLGDGPEAGPGYDPDGSAAPLIDPLYNHGKLLRMILNTGAKMVWDAVGFYHTGNWYFEWILKTLKHDTDFLHAADPEIIFGASLMECIPKEMKVELPPIEVINMFWHGSRPTTADAQYFDPKLMYIDYAIGEPYGNHEGRLDLKKPETLLWYFYLSARYIDAGCESIHFGDLFSGCRDDSGNQELWRLVQLIRAYANSHARRRLVLIDTHAGPDPTDYYANLNNFLFGWYYDPTPGSPLPNWKRQLIFDFHSLGTYYQRNTAKACYDPALPSVHFGISKLPVQLAPYSGLLNRSRGGLHPLGWLCSHNPNLCRFDSGSLDPTGTGCGSAIPTGPNPVDTYGYDNTSWFARQTKDEKKAILKYSYYKIKCADPYSHFCMPSRLIIRMPGFGAQMYYHAFTEETTIKDIWNGVYAGSNDWSPHNFTQENVANTDVPPQSSLVRVGSDKVFFISTDGYIHGYVHNNGVYNGGNWLTVSPSFSAQILHGQMIGGPGGQVKAKSDLVASPDGSRLLYIGVDGYIHGFKIHNVWDYEYFTFMKPDMSFQNITAVGALIYPDNDRIYYIGTYPSFDDEKRIHGFLRSSSGSWNTVSPTYSASSMHGQNVNSQTKADGALTYVRQGPYDRIYYRDIFGYLSYFEVRSPGDYYWSPCPGNWDLHAQGLKIVGNLAVHQSGSEKRFYFVGRYGGDSSYFIHCLVDTGSSWHTVSPSYSASMYGGTPISSQLQSYKDGNIAVSPDGKTIVYFPAGHPIGSPVPSDPYPFLCCFHNVDGVNYHYQCFVKQISESNDWVNPGNSLQFANNSEFFFISSFWGGDVQRFKFEECFCINSTISSYE